tara:strand:- start:1419 stop:1736 length:318 start_codon:yes stop_codon:yes gene_type:complete
MILGGPKKLWEKILLKRTSKYAIQLIEEVMDSEPRTLNEILDLMYDEIENKRKDSSISSQRQRLVPTRGELRIYLSKHYNSVLFDKRNNRQMKTRTSNTERRYWK